MPRRSTRSATSASGKVTDAALPNWLTDEDVDYFTSEFERTGYRSGLNWYRNSRQNWELMAACHNAPLLAPSLFVGGDRDLVLNRPGFRDLVGFCGSSRCQT
jgi:hypothetical protein